jgi:hypothetical protein
LNVGPDTTESIANAVQRCLAEMLEETGKPPGHLAASTLLRDELGLSSVEVLRVARTVEERLMPGQLGAVPVTELRTVADLQNVLSRALAPATEASVDEELLASVRRADARRRRRGQA